MICSILTKKNTLTTKADSNHSGFEEDKGCESHFIKKVVSTATKEAIPALVLIEEEKKCANLSIKECRNRAEAFIK
jgi:hypothetical protein